MMKNINQKGFGLVMAIMVIVILLIMAASFFQVTNYSTRTITADNRKLELYWAAESASNFNVNWWANQPDSVRIKWPAEYIPPSSKRKASAYSDTDLAMVKEGAFPHTESTTTDGVYYLHGSSLAEGNTEVTIPELEDVGGRKLVTTRYKGERKDDPGYAVWVLDSYAWDKETGEMANIVLSNVYNIKVIGWNELLANSEAIYNTMAGSGFGGALGAFHQKDVRFGPCYFNDIIRIDIQTGGTDGARFYRGPVKSSALQAGSPLAQSRWGNDIETTKDLIDTDKDYGYGMALRSSAPKDQDDAIAMLGTVFDSGKTPYYKNEKVIDVDGLLWTWDDIVEYGPTNGFYFLEEGGFPAGDVDIVLEYDDKTNATIAIISSGTETKKIPVGRGAGKYGSVVVTKKYSDVSIKGVSGDDFTLFTENNQVNLTGNLYAQEMDPTLEKLTKYSSSIDQNATDEKLLEIAWKDMLQIKPEGKIGIVANHNHDVEPQSENPWYISTPKGQLLFTTAAMIGYNGFLGLESALSNSKMMKYVNIGSVITLADQGAKLGDPSGKWTKALIQDATYEDPEEAELPPGFGPGPSQQDPTETVFGLNPKHRWTSESYKKTDNWKEVVWRYVY
ncbi:MAG: hypothetical protein R6V47_01275 [Candidatus Delongbacteria bacterium]